MGTFIVLLLLADYCNRKSSSRHVESIPYLRINQNGKEIFSEFIEVGLTSEPGHDDVVQSFRFPPIAEGHSPFVYLSLVPNIVSYGDWLAIFDDGVNSRTHQHLCEPIGGIVD